MKAVNLLAPTGEALAARLGAEYHALRKPRPARASEKGLALNEAIASFCGRVGVQIPQPPQTVDPVWRGAMWWDLKYRAGTPISSIAQRFNTSSSFVMDELERVATLVSLAKGGDLDACAKTIRLGLEEWVPPRFVALAGGALADQRKAAAEGVKA
jgi:hypothetical protein